MTRPTSSPSSSRLGPVTPFYDSANSAANSVPVVKSVINFLDDRYFSDVDGQDAETEVSREEAEAASWLLPNMKAMENPDLNSGDYFLPEIVPYLDLDYGHVDPFYLFWYLFGILLLICFMVRHMLEKLGWVERERERERERGGFGGRGRSNRGGFDGRGGSDGPRHQKKGFYF
ncbi:hypothetical protein PRUPE_1G019200 [Prunus persica]|uniref:Uncharacterized protein n=1 Tax=Prunus persica TaxID=3760 RepID=A0A251QRE3_PRUPE|nr:hypothetical protein PRUPE_1G019200 [Prunus persica]